MKRVIISLMLAMIPSVALAQFTDGEDYWNVGHKYASLSCQLVNKGAPSIHEINQVLAKVLNSKDFELIKSVTQLMESGDTQNPLVIAYMVGFNNGLFPCAYQYKRLPNR